MAHLNIFEQDAFSVMSMSEAIISIENQWGMIGEMGLFTPEGIIGNVFSIDIEGGVLNLVQSSERGGSLPGANKRKRSMKHFGTRRFGEQDTIMAADIAGIRATGKATELMQVANVVAKRQNTIRGNVDITREYIRSGAIQGIVRDADGSVLYNWFDEFGVTQKVVDFTFGTADTNFMNKCREINRHIKVNLLGDVSAGTQALMHPAFTDRLMTHSDFERRYNEFGNKTGIDPLRDDSSNGFRFGEIYWKEYMGEASVPQEDGSSIVRSFIPDGEAVILPMGTRDTFKQINGSADYLSMCNEEGQDFYSGVFKDPKDRFAEIEGFMDTMPICRRPGVLVRAHSSN